MNQPARDVEGAKELRHTRQLSLLSRLVFAVALCVPALGFGAAGAAAYGVPVACTGRTEMAAFARWGDKAGYFLVPNGGFEAGSAEWQLSGGAGVVGGNEPYFASGAGSNSLRIPPSGAVESRTICVSMGEDTIRLFVNNPKVQGSILHVEANVRNPTTGQIGQTAFDVNGDAAPAGWAPTMRLQIPNLFGGNGTETLTLRFTTRGSPAIWGVDDVFVDPYKSY